VAEFEDAPTTGTTSEELMLSLILGTAPMKRRA
jgi:hypothetical protein